MSKKHNQKSKSMLLAEMAYTKADQHIWTGLKIGQLIALLCLHDKFEWDAQGMRDFYEGYTELLGAYHFGKIDGEALLAAVDEIKEYCGIDILETVVIKEDE